jgi:hypothetical protein
LKSKSIDSFGIRGISAAAPEPEPALLKNPNNPVIKPVFNLKFGNTNQLLFHAVLSSTYLRMFSMFPPPIGILEADPDEPDSLPLDELNSETPDDDCGGP